MLEISTIGLDLAKHSFTVHGVGPDGHVALQRTLRRSQVLGLFSRLPACLVGLEACAGAHYWAREIARFGHDVRLIPPAYVKPYVRRQKNDATDAAAICEAVSRPSMRFCQIKTEAQQASLCVHRARERLIAQRTGLLNALRAHLAETGQILPAGAGAVIRLARALTGEPVALPVTLPDAMRPALDALARAVLALDREIAGLDKSISETVKGDARAQRLMSTPGIGPVTASALCATLGDASAFRSGRELAAFLGLVPRQNTTGGKPRLGRVSKMGDSYLRRLLTVGARAVLASMRRRPARDPGPKAVWAGRLVREKPFALAASALANKTARIVYALLRDGGVYQDRPAAV